MDNAPEVARKLAPELRKALAESAPAAKIVLATHAVHRHEKARHLLSRDFFAARLDFLLDLQRRIRFPISVVEFNLVDLERLKEAEQVEAVDRLRESLEEYLAGEQAFFAYQRSFNELVMVLPAQAIERAEEVGREIQKGLAKALGDLSPRLRFNVQAVPLKEKAEIYRVRTAS